MSHARNMANNNKIVIPRESVCTSAVKLCRWSLLSYRFSFCVLVFATSVSDWGLDQIATSEDDRKLRTFCLLEYFLAKTVPQVSSRADTRPFGYYSIPCQYCWYRYRSRQETSMYGHLLQWFSQNYFVIADTSESHLIARIVNPRLESFKAKAPVAMKAASALENLELIEEEGEITSQEWALRWSASKNTALSHKKE